MLVIVNARIVVLVLRNVRGAGFNLKRDGRMLRCTKTEQRSKYKSDPCTSLAQSRPVAPAFRPPRPQLQQLQVVAGGDRPPRSFASESAIVTAMSAAVTRPDDQRQERLFPRARVASAPPVPLSAPADACPPRLVASPFHEPHGARPHNLLTHKSFYYKGGRQKTKTTRLEQSLPDA